MANEIVVTADINRVSVSPTWKINTGELNARQIKVNLSQDYDICDTVICTFTDGEGNQQRSEVVDGYCAPPYYEIPCEIEVGVYGEVFEGDEVVKRISPRPSCKIVFGGSYINAEGVSPVPTPDEFAELLKGKIPTITIDYSQMVSEDTIQFTEEQWEILTDDETKILFADAPRWVVDAKYKILYKCGTYSELPSQGALYYEIIGTPSPLGFLMQRYRLNGQERQLKMEQEYTLFTNTVNPPSNGDMLKIDQDRISKAEAGVDYSLVPEIKVLYSQIEIREAEVILTLNDSDWEIFTSQDTSQILWNLFSADDESEYMLSARNGLSGSFFSYSGGIIPHIYVFDLYNVSQHKVRVTFNRDVLLTNVETRLTNGDLLKFQNDEIYAAQRDVDYVTKQYVDSKGFKEVNTLNIWEVGNNTNGSMYKVSGDIYYALNKTIPDHGQPQYLIVFKRFRRNAGSYYIYQWNWICFSTDYNDYDNAYICVGNTTAREDTGAPSLGEIHYLESREFLDTTINASSRDTHYPSSKAVYDAIQAALYVDSEGEI